MLTSEYSLATHNGTWTIRSLKSGEHRTVRVHTQKPDAKFAPGERIVSLLVGPDNESSYRGFGFVSAAGTVSLWKKHRNSKVFVWLALAIENPERFDGKCEFLFEGRCRVCNRKLTDPVSITTGIGPTCASRE